MAVAAIPPASPDAAGAGPPPPRLRPETFLVLQRNLDNRAATRSVNRAKGTLLGGNGAQGREPPATGVDRPPTPLANGVGVQRDGPGQGGGVDPQQLTNVQPALSQYSKRCGTKSPNTSKHSVFRSSKTQVPSRRRAKIYCTTRAQVHHRLPGEKPAT